MLDTTWLKGPTRARLLPRETGEPKVCWAIFLSHNTTKEAPTVEQRRGKKLLPSRSLAGWAAEQPNIDIENRAGKVIRLYYD